VTAAATIATVTGGPSGTDTAISDGPATRAATARTPPAATGTRHGRHSAATSTPPVTATTNVTIGAPPSTATRSTGASPWLNANRPHGNPPNGARSRSASCATHSSPVSTGHDARHRSASGLTHADAAPSSPIDSACDTDSRIHGSHPVCRLVHDSSGTNSTSPASTPSPNPSRTRRRCTAAASIATAIGANHHNPYGGNAASNAPPAPAASRQAAGSLNGGAVTRGRLPAHPVNSARPREQDRGAARRPHPDAPRSSPAGASERLPDTFGPTRRELAAPAVPLSTGPVVHSDRTPDDATGPRRPADPHPLDLAQPVLPGKGESRCERPRRRGTVARPASEGTKRTTAASRSRTTRRYAAPPGGCQPVPPHPGVSIPRRVPTPTRTGYRTASRPSTKDTATPG
jgi:hypothetical protein